ncbi:MAG TPA: imidazole glycerol phosphate synthase subunit HisH [Thermoanaerobaculia bacterium]|nr:imidazole glycerol phosphate synthase subunit HisH [Thermoanaerobaculia bacterium]
MSDGRDGAAGGQAAESDPRAARASHEHAPVDGSAANDAAAASAAQDPTAASAAQEPTAGSEAQAPAAGSAAQDAAAGSVAHDAAAGSAAQEPATVSVAGRRAPAARREVVVVDAGVGNLGNVVRAFQHLGAAATVTREAREVAAARCLILPGVGAFAPPREALRGPLEAALGGALADGAWLLGICVGFQLLFSASEEFGVTDGLGLLPGRVTRLPSGVPVPHIGWNRLHDLADHPLLAGLREEADRGGDAAAPVARPAGRHFYFVHGYAPDDVPQDVCLARATHGRGFAAVAGRGRVMGTQFHPERSGEAGLRLLANFLEMADGAAAGY